nr:2-hydroxyacid dehydrogenase [Sciscionella marina]
MPPSTNRVLVPWPEIRDRLEGVTAEIYDGDRPPPADLSDVVACVLPYDKGTAPAELLSRPMPELGFVQALSAGVEKLLPLVGPDVVLCNGRGLHDASVAEHALGLVLAAQRDVPRWVRQQWTGSWARAHTRSLIDATVVILGYGSIGAAIETRLRACGATVVPVANRARPETGVYGVAELVEILPRADILVLVLPDSAGTRGLLDAARLALLPDDALVVNVGRGRTVDTEALFAETASGRLRAALDVTDPEPLPPGHRLWTVDGVLITPHVAGGSASFYPRAADFAVAQLRRFAAGEPLENIVER